MGRGPRCPRRECSNYMPVIWRDVRASHAVVQRARSDASDTGQAKELGWHDSSASAPTCRSVRAPVAMGPSARRSGASSWLSRRASSIERCRAVRRVAGRKLPVSREVAGCSRPR